MTVDTGDLAALRKQLHAARTDIHAAIAEQNRKFAPILVRSAQTHARGEVDKRVTQSAQSKVTRDGFTVTFGGSGRLSGGAKLSEITRPYEFGTRNPEQYSKPYRSRHRTSGKAMQIRRRTKKQIPRAVDSGRFLHPALADVTPELVSGYVRAITNTITGH